MKKDLRNNFTDALNEEILSRKIFDKAKTSDTENIFIAETETKMDAEPVAPPEVKNFKRKKKIKKSPPKIETVEKIPEPKVEPKDNFEERVFAEAENDFYENQVAEIERNMRSKVEEKKNFAPPAFHSRMVDNDVQELDEEKDLQQPEYDPELHRKLTHAELIGVVLSVAMLGYSFVNLDKPLFFLAMSLLSHLLRPLVGGFFGKHNRAVQNAMRSFSLVLFFGAILFIFM